jgi:hypothetical protein
VLLCPISDFALHFLYMKKLFSALAIGGMVLMGGGCAATNVVSSIIGNDKVEGRWLLAFDLPEGWVMVMEYDEPRESVVTPDENVTHDLATVIVQSTDKAIVQGGTPDTATVPVETYVTKEYASIRVDHLDARRIIPADAQDLGNGFSTSEGRYYFVSSSGEKYQFVITSDDNDLTEEIAVILSAKTVTVFTDTPAEPTAEVQTNE